jgi:Mg2+ and Co2+ transporter CorA
VRRTYTDISVTIILSVPTLIASLYGMNVALPLEDHPAAFLLIPAFRSRWRCSWSSCSGGKTGCQAC